MARVLEFEAPEEFVETWLQELRAALSGGVGSYQELGHYPLIRVDVSEDKDETEFVKWLALKIDSGDLPRTMQIMRAEDHYEN